MDNRSHGRGIPAGLTAVVLLFAAGGLTGCTANTDDRVAYCTDEQGTIIDERSCDKTQSSHYRPGSHIWVGHYPTGLLPGQRASWSDPQYSGQRATASDAAGRSGIGVSESGHIATGTKGGIGIGSGSFGKSGSGSGKGGIGGAHGSSGS